MPDTPVKLCAQCDPPQPAGPGGVLCPACFERIDTRPLSDSYGR